MTLAGPRSTRTDPAGGAQPPGTVVAVPPVRPGQAEEIPEHLEAIGVLLVGLFGVELHAVDWLAAMTLAMQISKKQGAFDFDGQPATIYCSMVDSLNAIWLEDLSAQFLNDAEIYATASPGIKAASADWYQSDGDEGSSAFRAAYESQIST